MSPPPPDAASHTNQSITWTWTLDLTSKDLAALTEVCLSDPLLELRVRPGRREDAPHRAKVTVKRTDPADALRIIRKFDEDLQKHRIA